MKGRPYEPHQEEDRDRDGSQCAQYKDAQENPIPPSLKPRFFFLPDEYPIISSVRLPKDVKYIPDEWDSTHCRLQEYVRNHSSDRNGRHAAAPCREYNYARCRTCRYIPDSGYPAYEGVEAEPNLRARDLPHVVQERRDVVEVFVRWK